MGTQFPCTSVISEKARTALGCQRFRSFNCIKHWIGDLSPKAVSRLDD
jgi:hypothetical protein